MLHQFITTNREEIITRTRAKVAKRQSPRPTEAELTNGVPLFLDQFIQILHRSPSAKEEMGKGAVLHGGDRLRMGFTVGQVVHDYGDICQAITELAIEQKAEITVEEFHIFNRCLDDAIAHSVTEYELQRERSSADRGTERLASLAHEMRNQLAIGKLAFEALRRGIVAIGGSTGALLGRSLDTLDGLINRSLAEVRLEAGSQLRERVSMAELIEDVEVAAAMDAKGRDLQFSIQPVDLALEVEADRQLLAAAVMNLLQNAFKFTRPQGHVSLLVQAAGDRVLIEIEDECGGLPAGKAEDLFQPFLQRGTDRTGLGLGLTITRRSIQAMGGEVRVRSLPGKGCIFTIDLPRK